MNTQQRNDYEEILLMLPKHTTSCYLIERAVEYIKKHYREPLTLPDVAEHVGVTPQLSVQTVSGTYRNQIYGLCEFCADSAGRDTAVDDAYAGCCHFRCSGVCGPQLFHSSVPAIYGLYTDAIPQFILSVP